MFFNGLWAKTLTKFTVLFKYETFWKVLSCNRQGSRILADQLVNLFHPEGGGQIMLTTLRGALPISLTFRHACSLSWTSNDNFP